MAEEIGTLVAHPDVVDVVADLVRQFPALNEAVQPSIDGRAFFLQDAQLVAPNPARGRRWLGPIFAEGDCLEPVVPAGRGRYFVDPTQEPSHGDLVLVVAGQRTLRCLLDFGACDANWLAKYPRLPNTWVKQWQEAPGGPLLVAKSGAIPFGDCRLLGVARVA